MAITYKVKSKGFHGGKLYDPVGKRPTITVDKPFTKAEMPSWVEPLTVAKKAPKAKKSATFLDNKTDTASSTVETV